MLLLVSDIIPMLILYSSQTIRLLSPFLSGWISVMTAKAYWCHLFHEFIFLTTRLAETCGWSLYNKMTFLKPKCICWLFKLICLHTIIFFFKVFIFASPPSRLPPLGLCRPERQHHSPRIMRTKFTASLRSYPTYSWQAKSRGPRNCGLVLLQHHLQAIIHRAVYRLALCSLNQWQRQ